MKKGEDADAEYDLPSILRDHITPGFMFAKNDPKKKVNLYF